MGKTMADSCVQPSATGTISPGSGTDMFGAPTFERPWDGETMKGARAKADVAFEMFTILGFPFFAFHDRDVVPEGASLAEFGKNLAEMTDIFAKKMQRDRRQAALGHRQSLQPSALHVRRGDQSRPRRLRLCRRAGEERHRRDARARRRQLRSVGRPRGLRDAAQHRPEARAGAARTLPVTWSSTTSTRSASRA